MSTQIPRLTIGLQQPASVRAESELIKELEARGRPYADVSFRTHKAEQSILGSLSIGKLSLSEAALEPLTWKTLPIHQLSFLIPLCGQGSVIERGRSIHWAASHAFLQFAYANPLEIHASRSHMVAVVPSVDELQRVLTSLTAVPQHCVERLLVAQTEVHGGMFGGIDYYAQARELLSIVQFAQGDSAFLARIGMDDIFHRLLAQMIIAKESGGLAERPKPSISRSNKAIEIVCDHVITEIGTPLTMTKMEELTGLSGRALNYAFRSRFNCSPQQWQRNYLLDEARRKLAASDVPPSIKAVAFELGFSSASSFAFFYKRRFGEHPYMAV